ncbi:hypothetical protein [Streptomyces sp. NPDC008139]|uniref:hypothetical protein n=1 Tax=Streptomyces sp. NPDC008139 TaxID=3364814 RepID=UPI0036E2D899
MYQQTANWTFTAGASATFRFHGSTVALHAVRDTDQGIMSLSVDGGSPVTVDNYAAARNASGTVWTSPALPSGSHTLMTITNTGGRNAHSTGNNIAVDRADVSWSRNAFATHTGPSATPGLLATGPRTGTGHTASPPTGCRRTSRNA